MTKSRDDIQSQIIKKAWEDAAFKKELISDPKAAIEKAFGVRIPDGMNIKVVEETADTVYLVIPSGPVISGNADLGTGAEVGTW